MKPYEKTGILTPKDLTLPTTTQLEKGVAILECIQHIPCNPCVDICPVHAITMDTINTPPKINYTTCIGCGKCISICPGLAIFLIKYTKNNTALLTLPYEFYPIPKKGDTVNALNREGTIIHHNAPVKKVTKHQTTHTITIEIPKKHAMNIRNIQVPS